MKQGSVQRGRMVRFCRHKFPYGYKYMGGCTFRTSPLLHSGSEITGRRRNKKTLQTPKKGLQRCFLASQRGFEPPTPRLGVIAFGSYRVVRRASKCPQTRMNTGFFSNCLLRGIRRYCLILANWVPKSGLLLDKY